MPPVEDLAAWTTPPEPEEVEDVAAFLITAMEPGAGGNRVRTLTGLVAMRGLTRAELLLVLRELPFRNAYGEGFRLDVLAEIVQTSRRIRAIIGDPRDGRPRIVTERQMFEACQSHPEHFRPEDFGIAGYDAEDRPLYRYARKSGPHRHEPQPQLAEARPPGRRGEDPAEHGTVALGNLLAQPEPRN